MAELDNISVGTVEATGADSQDNGDLSVESAEIARLKAEIARQKAAVDKATKEAADAKRSLRARQTEEEAAAEEKRAQDEERDRKLAEYEKRFAIADAAKQVMKFVDDSSVADSIAESLYGATDLEKAISALNKAWVAKENQLKLTYGKIPAPGVGSSEGGLITKPQLDAMSYMDRLQFAQEHPDEYNKLMGR